MMRCSLAVALLLSAVVSAGDIGQKLPVPYGVCSHVTRDEFDIRGEIYRMMEAGGLGYVRSDFDWHRCQKEMDGSWDFGKFDTVVDDAASHGITVLPILYGIPRWAVPAYEHLDDFKDYVRAVVSRYGMKMPVVEIWNEPNHRGFWKDPNPTNYLAVLKAAYEAVKSVEPRVRVSFGGTSGVPYDFIEEVYRLGGARYFDILSIHPYSHPNHPERRLDAMIDHLRKKVMAKYGDAEKPIWLTEIGWPTHTQRTGGERSNSEARQGAFLARAAGIAFAERVEGFFWYEFQAPETDQFDIESHFGIVHANLSPKPAWGGYKNFTLQRPVGSVQLPCAWRNDARTAYFPQWMRPDGRPAGMFWRQPHVEPDFVAPEPLDLEFDGGKVEFHDVWGKRVHPEKVGENVWRVPVGESPIYFTGAKLCDPVNVFNVRDFRAKGDGNAKDTAAIQRAIDAASAAGGGEVLLPKGVYLCGSLFLKSGVDFHLAEGAVLKGSPDREDYNALDVAPQNWGGLGDGDNISGGHLILCVEQENVVLRGPGKIDGNVGSFLKMPDGSHPPHKLSIPWRPAQMLWFVESKNIAIRDIEIADAPYWSCFIYGCEDVVVERANIHTVRKPHTYNGDGLDIDSSRRVHVSGCKVSTADDSITLRADGRGHLKKDGPCEDIVVSNCIFSSDCNAIRLGVGNGTIRNCSFSDIRIVDTRYAVNAVGAWSRPEHGVDISNIDFQDMEIDAKGFCKFYYRHATDSVFDGIAFRHVRGRVRAPSIFDDTPKRPFRNLIFEDVELEGETSPRVVGKRNAER